MNKLNIWLYDNQLTSDPNDYYGKVKTNGILTNKELAQLLVEEGTEYKEEAILEILSRTDRLKVSKLAEGFAVNNGVCYARVAVNGSFQGSTDRFDKKEHKVAASFTPGAQLRTALQKVDVDILGVATVDPVIGKVIDSLTNQEDSTITPNNVITIKGDKIKIAGDEAANGVYFINQNDDSRTKCLQVIKNERKELMVMVPDLAVGEYELEIVTQFTASRTNLKEPRTTRFDHLLIVE